MNKFRKEQHIEQRYNKNSDTWSFRVKLRQSNPIIDKTFSEKDYGSARRAYDQAIIFRNQSLVDINNGIAYCVSDKTLEEVFYENFDLFPVREETKRKYVCEYNKYIKDDIMIKNINRAYITNNLNSMIKDCSDDTIQRVFTIWKKIFKTAIINEYVINNPTDGIICPKSQKIIVKKRDKGEEVKRETLDKIEDCIRDSFKGESNQVITALEVMWYCGLRPCEVFALNKSDIKNGYINVNKELGSDIATGVEYVDNENRNIIRKCKTEASNRLVPIPSKLQEILNKYSVEGEIMFPNRKNTYFNVSNVGNRISKFGIPFNMYQLRHTVATRLVTNGVDQRTIIEILGHEHIDMSIYYARSNENLKKNALEM